MLPLAILLLLAAVGLLLAALVTGQNSLAWGSVGVSAALAVVLLLLSRRAGRRRRDAAQAAQAAADAALDDDDPYVAEQPKPQLPEASAATADPVTAESAVAEPATADPVVAEPADPESGDAEPGEEDTDAADLLVIWELADEVLVVDEHPRYHLARCDWPDAEQAERLPIREARELDFTPCALCRPDAALARRRRAALARAEEAPEGGDALNGGEHAGQTAADAEHNAANAEHNGAEPADAGQQPVAAGGSRNAGGSTPEAATPEAGKER